MQRYNIKENWRYSLEHGILDVDSTLLAVHYQKLMRIAKEHQPTVTPCKYHLMIIW